ncbi:MAG TPA: ATP-binding protein [Vicinamibacterales bacterium]|nr:ATP-binding protein [Vicinamibacterales bacterium]
MPWLSAVLGYVLLFAIGSALLREAPAVRLWFGTIAQLVPIVAAVVTIARRRGEWVGTQRLFWLVIAAGYGLWTAGHAGWMAGRLANGESWLGWHTVFTLCGGSAPLVALAARPHRGPRPAATAATAIDIAGLGLFVAFAATFFVLVPALDPTRGAASLEALLVMAQILRGGLVVGLAWAFVAARGTPWRPVFARLAGGAAAGFALRVWTSLAIAEGEYQPGSLHDLAWIVPALCTAWAAAEAPATSADVNRGDVGGSGPWLLAATVAMVPLLGYGLLGLMPMGQPIDAFRLLVTTLTVLAGLALVAARLAVQQTELQRAGARLRLLAAVAQQTEDLVLVARPDGRIEEVNDAFLRATGFDRAELASLGFDDLTAPGQPRLAELEPAVRAQGAWRGTIVRRRKEGTTFPAACTLGALRDDAGRITHLVSVERDVTEDHRLRDQLVATERLAATAEVVAGVAHEINNPLQAILGCTELLLDGVPPETRRDLEVIRAQAMRAGQIVRDLLAFIRRRPGERRTVDLNEIARATAALRAFHLEQLGIELDVRCERGPLAVQANAEEIRQVILNLLLNAEQAILRGRGTGRIVVATSREPAGVVLQVADDGPGVPPDIRGRIFEPFFTTKDVGEGSGLGLSISLGIARSHGGTLEYVPGAAQGAVFRLVLPPAAATTDSPAPSEDAARASSHTPYALIVEDDEAIRVLLVRLLERRGFRVVHAANGVEALAYLDAGAPDLVVCDLRMPRVNGIELYRRATAARPSVAGRFLFITGDAPNEEAARLVAAAGVPLLQKPFSAAQLDAALSRVVAERPAETPLAEPRR